MAVEAQHLAQYYHNKSMLSMPIFNGSSSHRDWAITIAFYCALHLVEKTLADATPCGHSTSHVDRNFRVARDRKFRPIASYYQVLYNQSRRARYECVSFSKEDFETIISALSSIERFLNANKSAV